MMSSRKIMWIRITRWCVLGRRLKNFVGSLSLCSQFLWLAYFTVWQQKHTVTHKKQIPHQFPCSFMWWQSCVAFFSIFHCRVSMRASAICGGSSSTNNLCTVHVIWFIVDFQSEADVVVRGSRYHTNLLQISEFQMRIVSYLLTFMIMTKKRPCEMIRACHMSWHSQSAKLAEFLLCRVELGYSTTIAPNIVTVYRCKMFKIWELA